MTQNQQTPKTLFSGPVKSVLFICTGNCSRSVMAAEISRSLLPALGIDLKIESAGTDAKPGLRPTENTWNILKQFGVPYSETHQAKRYTKELLEQADLIFVMERYHLEHLTAKHPEAKEKIFLLADFCPEIKAWIQNMGVPDPLGMNLAFYENVFQMIDKSCKAILQNIKENCSKK